MQPRYQQIADDLRRQIELGKLTPESRLPNEVDLQEEFGASRNTVRDAIKLLVQRGLLEPRGREGTFVRKAIVPFVTTLSTNPKPALAAAGRKARPTHNLYASRAGTLGRRLRK